MTSFDARLRLPGQTRLPLGVEVDISNERMTLTAGTRKVAEWPLHGIDVSSHSDGFHIRVDEEEMVLNVSDPARFAIEMGMTEPVRRPAPAEHTAPGRRLPRLGYDGIDAPSNGIPGPPPDPGRLDEDIETRIEATADALTSDSVSPGEAFARWIGLLEELNRLLGEGSISAEVFHRHNTRLLGLFSGPDPSGT